MRMKIARSWTGICFAMLAAACSVSAEDLLTLKSPLERQVVQRTEQNQAEITFSGLASGGADVIKAKADLSPGAKKGEAVKWTAIAEGKEISKGKFSGQMTLKAGGWYTITVRALRGGNVVAETSVEKVGVGEVFVTAGQSNSANFGYPRQVAKDDRVVFKGKNFVPAKDPIPGGCGRDGSVWPILGDLIVESQQVPVCFRSSSPTWSEVKKWMPGVQHKSFKLYNTLVGRVGEFPKGGIRAILWRQGEADSVAKTPAKTPAKTCQDLPRPAKTCQDLPRPAEACRDRLKTVIESLNKDAGYDITWFVAQASFRTKSTEAEQKEVAKGQQLLWKEGVAKQGPNTDELGPEYRNGGVHFNQRGLTAHAERWFKALSDEYKWKPDPSDRVPGE